MEPAVDGTIYRDVVSKLKRGWHALATTDVAFKIVALILLTPLLGLLLRSILALSGAGTISDQEILYFLIGPLGWLCFILVAALWLAILALEMSALMAIVVAQSAGKKITLLGALRFSAAHAVPVIRVTLRIAALGLLVAAPFLVIAGLVYNQLLTEFDINYYLKEQPPVFWAAVAIGGLLLLGLVAIILRLVTNWLFALPLVVFEGVAPSSALAESSRRAHSHRKKILLWIVLWMAATTLLSAITSATVGLVGRAIVPQNSESLQYLSFVIGTLLLIWFVTGLIVNLISSTTFATLLLSLYEAYGSDGGDTTARLHLEEIENDATGSLLSYRKIALAGVVACVVAVCVGVAAMLSLSIEDNVEIMAHRGASKLAPENTLAAIRQAIADEADWVEIDVQETLDGEVIVFHDSDFMKLANVNLKVWDAQLKDLDNIDIGSWFDPQFSAERVPTLAEVLAECKDKIGVNIELKYYGHDERLEQRVADIVDAAGMNDQVIAMSLNQSGVAKMKQIRPDWKVGLLMSVAAGGISNIKADFLAVNASFVSRSLVRRAHDSGKQIFVWTVNDAPTISRMTGRGVDAILTDRPALAREVLAQRASMSVPQRLVLELSSVLGLETQISEQ